VAWTPLWAALRPPVGGQEAAGAPPGIHRAVGEGVGLLVGGPGLLGRLPAPDTDQQRRRLNGKKAPGGGGALPTRGSGAASKRGVGSKGGNLFVALQKKHLGTDTL